jgi:Cu(I)/Ag(I) efflux system membrane fusion protein
VSPWSKGLLLLTAALLAPRLAAAPLTPIAPITHGPRGAARVALTFDACMTAAMARGLDPHYNHAVIAELQHPEWTAAQQEYLAVRATGDAALAAAARQRLALLGMPTALVERVERSGQPVTAVTVTAPVAGLVAELGVRPGMTVMPGATLARINGLGSVWVEATVPEALAAPLRPGQGAQVRLAAMPGAVLPGRVATVLPEANRDSRTLRVRIELPNPGLRLRPGLTAQVTLAADAARDAVVVPAEAVIRTGRRALVYVVDAPGRYRPVEVETGAEAGDLIAVTRGLEAGQAVVASGQFLIDSEASLRGITARAAPAAASAPADDPHAAHRAASAPVDPHAAHRAAGARP